MGRKSPREETNSEGGRCRVRKARVDRTHFTENAEGNEIPGEGPSAAHAAGRDAPGSTSKGNQGHERTLAMI